MPISGFAVRMLWNDDSNGISETYYWTGATDDPFQVVYPAAKNLMQARTSMMGAGVSAVSFRISKLGTFRAYLNSSPQDVMGMAPGPFAVQVSLNTQQVAAGIGATMDGSADIARAAILANFYSGITQHARKFLSGVPDVMIRTNPDGPWVVGVPAWNSLFNAWAGLLISGTLKWAFKNRTPPSVAPWAPVNVAALQFDNTTGLWGADAPTFGVGIAVGSMLQLRGFRMTSRAYVPVNGTYQIASIVASTIPGNSIYYLRGSQTIAGTQVAVFGNARGVDYSLFPFTKIVPGGETTHKRGNSSLGSRGKRRTVQRVTA